MSYCLLEKTETSAVSCLCCKHCLPPAERVNGRMCRYDTYNGEEEIEEEIERIRNFDYMEEWLKEDSLIRKRKVELTTIKDKKK